MLKYALLGLLARQPRHGYELKQAFESFLGGTWQLNIGQVYTTLARLERDGLVRSRLMEQDLLPDRKVYSLTDAGRQTLEAWLVAASDQAVRMKDEFFIKLLIHQLVGEGDALELIWKQRQVYMQNLNQLAELRADPSLARPTALLVDGAILHLEADLKWLDLCEERLQEEHA